MIANLRESKAKLSELVERANQGEDVLITVRGKIKARLTKAGGPERSAADRKAWLRRLRSDAKKYSSGSPGKSTQETFDEIREDII